MKAETDGLGQDRRLSDKLLAAFDQACGQNALGVANLLVQAMELALTQEGGRNKVEKRYDVQAVIDAGTRLKALEAAREAEHESVHQAEEENRA